MTARTGEASPEAMTLADVHTSVDASRWLRQQARDLHDMQAGAPSATHAIGLRKAAATLAVLAMTLTEHPDDVHNARGIRRLAGGYRRMASAPLDDRMASYQQACGHVAKVLKPLGARLTEAAAHKRGHRGQAQRQPLAERSRDL